MMSGSSPSIFFPPEGEPPEQAASADRMRSRQRESAKIRMDFFITKPSFKERSCGREQGVSARFGAGPAQAEPFLQ